MKVCFFNTSKVMRKKKTRGFAGLRFTLHQLLGCLAYTIFPRYNQRWMKEAIVAKNFVIP